MSHRRRKHVENDAKPSSLADPRSRVVFALCALALGVTPFVYQYIRSATAPVVRDSDLTRKREMKAFGIQFDDGTEGSGEEKPSVRLNTVSPLLYLFQQWTSKGT
eukprot:Rmarinus@m.4158